MRDFTLKIYKLLLNTLVAQGYSFQTFSQYLKEQTNSSLVSPDSCRDSSLILLRHDVEARYEQALKFAQIQNQLGIKGSYFFRLLPKSFKPEIVKQIADLGHEIGYHYDDLVVCKGDYKKAIERFQKNLETLRAIAPVQSICMDGSPLSKYDNKELWNRNEKETKRKGELSEENNVSNLNLPTRPSAPSHYRSFGIIGEPYFDLDFNKVFYLTDTGRMWNGNRFSVRDRVQSSLNKDWPSFHSTKDIISAIEKGIFPKQAMITFHPQRWNDAFLFWFKELVFQNAKNQVKRFLVKKGHGD